MATKREKKENLRKKIIDAAEIYSKELAGKVFLYVYGDEYFELSFQTDCFLHLTGVETKLDAKRFYKYSKNKILASNQFYFTNTHPYKTAIKKLSCLGRVPELTNTMVCILKGLRTVTLTYKIGVTNLEFTLGLTENIDSNGNKKNDYLLPRTLRVKDDTVSASSDGEIVDFIFMKDASHDKYTTMTFADTNKKIPKSVYELLDEALIDRK